MNNQTNILALKAAMGFILSTDTRTGLRKSLFSIKSQVLNIYRCVLFIRSVSFFLNSIYF